MSDSPLCGFYPINAVLLDNDAGISPARALLRILDVSEKRSIYRKTPLSYSTYAQDGKASYLLKKDSSIGEY